MRSEWTLANNKNNELCNVVFGDNVARLTQAEYRRYYSTNGKALDAFLARKEAGLSLSDRVWRYSDTFRNEIEMGLDIGIRSGLDAPAMARELQTYLQHPDKLFRRVADEHGHLHLSKAAAAFHPGRGVYRSSYMNARRLAATETNIAYRTADHLRWQQMDFVVGIKIQLSNNHNCRGVPEGAFFDICDELKGDYPKDFKFTGWHPHCRCYATPILKTPEELAADNQRIMQGEEPAEESENAVTDLPDNFRGWVEANQDRIDRAKSLPYFLRDNEKLINGVNEELVATTAQLTARLEAINNARIVGLLPKRIGSTLMYIDEQIAAKNVADAELRISRLEAAVQRHRGRTPEQAKAISKQWQERGIVRRYADRILRVMGGISDVDTTALEQALKRGNIENIRNEANKLRDIGKRITALDKIDDPLEVARQTSMAIAEQINANVTRTLGKMPTALEHRKAQLEFEIDWMGKEGKRRYPSTYQFAQAAYKKELALVQRKIDIKAIADSVGDALAFAATSNSEIIKDLASEMNTMLGSSRTDLAALQAKAKELNKEYNQLKKVQGVLPPQPVAQESLQELAKRLGGTMPPTLRNLEKKMQKAIAAGKYSGWSSQEIADAKRIIKDVLDNGCYGMNVPRVDSNGNDDVIDKIFNSWFKNQIETGTGKGMVSIAGRKKASAALFGTPKGTAAVDYERYGFLMDRDILAQAKSQIAAQYWSDGDGIQVRFKKNKVVATFTMEDSLGSGLIPSLCSDPKVTSFTSFSGRSGKAIVTTTANTKSAIDATNKFAFSYIELQYHGKLTLDCVESVFIPRDVVPRLNAGVLDLIRKSGAIIYSEGTIGELIQL